MQRSIHVIKPWMLKHFPLCPRTTVDRRRLLRPAGPDKGRDKAVRVSVLMRTPEKLAESYLPSMRGPKGDFSPSSGPPKPRRLAQGHADGFQSSHSCQRLCWRVAKGRGLQQGRWPLPAHQTSGGDTCLPQGVGTS